MHLSPRHVTARAQASDLPGGLRNIVGAFQMVPDPMARYKQLLYFASKLEGLDESLKTEQHKVQVRCTVLGSWYWVMKVCCIAPWPAPRDAKANFGICLFVHVSRLWLSLAVLCVCKPAIKRNIMLHLETHGRVRQDMLRSCHKQTQQYKDNLGCRAV